MNIQALKIKADQLGVTSEVYLFLRQSNRKIQYYIYDLKTESIIIDGEQVIFISSREDSLDRLREQLYNVLHQLTPGERRLVDEIFYRGRSQRELAQTLGISQPAIKKRCDKVISRLREIMKISN